MSDAARGEVTQCTSVVIGVDGGSTKTCCVVIELEEYHRQKELKISRKHRETDSEYEYDSTSQVLGRCVTGSYNHNSVGEDQAKYNVLSSIRSALADAELYKQKQQQQQQRDINSSSGTFPEDKVQIDVKGICLCLSGTDRQEDKEMVKRWFTEDNKRRIRVLDISGRVTPPTTDDNNDDSECVLIIENDSLSALCSGTGGDRNGIVLIAGTGTIAVAYKSFTNVDSQTLSVRAAGWGPAFGDGGSGFDIGYRSMCAVARMHDGRIPFASSSGDTQVDGHAVLDDVTTTTTTTTTTTDDKNNNIALISSNPDNGDAKSSLSTNLLPERIMRKVGAKSAEELLQWAYQEGGSWARVASLAPVVIDCAQDGDKHALMIIEEAVEELSGSIVAVVHKMNTLLSSRGQTDSDWSKKIVFVGGVLVGDGICGLDRSGNHAREMNILMEKLKTKLEKNFPNAQLVFPHDEPALGAALLMQKILIKDTL